MSNPNASSLDRLLRLANYYPSPHNSQPIRLRQSTNSSLELLFDTDRGLKSTLLAHLTSFITVGVFARHFELCAAALGHTANVRLKLPETDRLGEPGLIHLGTVKIDFDTHDPNNALKSLILKRQTSRKKYTAPLAGSESAGLVETAASHKLKLRLVGPARTRQIMWLNQRAVLDDMFDPAVRSELDRWLRYTKEEKQSQKDGLAYDCMEHSGLLIKLVVKYYKVFHWPLVSRILKRYYLQALADSSSVGYLTGKFETPAQAVEIGRCIIELWFELTHAGAFMHPFGAVVSNARAHADFDTLAGIHDESPQNYVAFIFRAGYSQKPVQSLRLPVKDHLLVTE